MTITVPTGADADMSMLEPDTAAVLQGLPLPPPAARGERAAPQEVAGTQGASEGAQPSLANGAVHGDEVRDEQAPHGVKQEPVAAP